MHLRVTRAIVIAVTSTALIAGTGFAANADDSAPPTPSATPTANPSPSTPATPNVQIFNLPRTLTNTAGKQLSVKFDLKNASGQSVVLTRSGTTKHLSKITAKNGSNVIKLPTDWWKSEWAKWTITVGAGKQIVTKNFNTLKARLQQWCSLFQSDRGKYLIQPLQAPQPRSRH